MLNELLQSLKSGETVSLSVTKTKDGSKVAVAAKVDLDPNDPDEVALTLRAALARPLLVTLDDADDADAVLVNALKTFHEQHRATRNDLGEYEASLKAERAAAREARAAKAAKKKKTSKKKVTAKAAAGEASAATPPAPSNQTLF